MGLLDFKNTLQQVKKDLLEKPKEALLGQKAKLLNQEDAEENKLIGFDKEESFLSSSKNNLRRYYQALYYGEGVYGMECNACCMMYFLQSYGLIPQNITRKEFEYAFTPLYPPKSIYGTNPTASTKKNIKIDGFDVKPVSDLFDNIFPKGAEFYLRGYKGGGAIFPHQTQEAIGKLQKIIKNFIDLSKKTAYDFLKSYREQTINFNNLKLKNKYNDLVVGTFDNKYFRQHVIFIGLHVLGPNYPGHYSIIVNTPTSVTFEGVDFLVYPADDPLYGNTKVYVPKNPLPEPKNIENLLLSPNYLIYPNCAIGV